MASTNSNNYSVMGSVMYSPGSNTGQYSDLSHTTSRPSSNVLVLNPLDSGYYNQISAFNKGLLNPNQNSPAMLPRRYYTVATAYGPPPTMQTQIPRTCAGTF